MATKDDGISDIIKLMWEKFDLADFNLSRYEEKSFLDITRSILCGGAAFFLGLGAGFAMMPMALLTIGSATAGMQPVAEFFGACAMILGATALTSAAYDLKVLYQTTAFLADKTVVAAANQFILKEPTTFGDFLRSSMNQFLNLMGMKPFEKPSQTTNDNDAKKDSGNLAPGI